MIQEETKVVYPNLMIAILIHQNLGIWLPSTIWDSGFRFIWQHTLSIDQLKKHSRGRKKNGTTLPI